MNFKNKRIVSSFETNHPATDNPENMKIIMNRRNLFKIISFFVFSSIFQSAEAKFTNKIKFPVDALDWMSRCADYLKSEFRGGIF
jgi:hypothetical protein